MAAASSNVEYDPAQRYRGSASAPWRRCLRTSSAGLKQDAVDVERTLDHRSSTVEHRTSARKQANIERALTSHLGQSECRSEAGRRRRRARPVGCVFEYQQPAQTRVAGRASRTHDPRFDALRKRSATSSHGVEHIAQSPADSATEAIRSSAQDAEHALGNLSSTTTDAIRTSAQDAERSLTGASTGVTTSMKQNATELERSLGAACATTAEAIAHHAPTRRRARSRRPPTT